MTITKDFLPTKCCVQ